MVELGGSSGSMFINLIDRGTMTTSPVYFRKEICDLQSFVSGKPIEETIKELGLTDIAKMDCNENPLGPSPKVLSAMEQELKQLNYYPERSCSLLRKEMAQRLKISDDMVIFSNGGDNCLFLMSCAFINAGEEIITADQTFIMYYKNAKIMGGNPVLVPLKKHKHDLDAMVKSITSKTKLIYVCNPNNPHGTIVYKEELDAFLEKVPKHVIVVLDEAYCEFVTDERYPNGVNYIKEGHNVIVLRTLSKLYGIAGLRVGYTLGRKELIEGLNKVREAFSVSRIAQAGALAALNDEAHKEKTLKTIKEGKAYLYAAFDEMGITYIPSHTNFIYLDVKRDSQFVFEFLLQQGVLIRPGNQLGSDTFIRVTIGSMDENRKFITALKKLLSV